jgi:hypothetical protein
VLRDVALSVRLQIRVEDLTSTLDQDQRVRVGAATAGRVRVEHGHTWIALGIPCLGGVNVPSREDQAVALKIRVEWPADRRPVAGQGHELRDPIGSDLVATGEHGVVRCRRPDSFVGHINTS